MDMDDEQPAFEVRYRNSVVRFRIYASGRVEGFPEGDDGPLIANYIPAIVSQAVAGALAKNGV